MKKKSFLTYSIMLLALLLAGCTKTDVSSEISSENISETSSEEVSSEDTTVHVTSVAIDAVSSTTLTVEDTLQLSATVLPEDATDKTVSWSTTDANIASVSDTGLVTAVGAGNATITVTSTDGELTDTIDLTINPKIIHVTSVTLSAGSTTIEVGETLALSVSVLPEDATDKTVTWASSNKNVATVSESGVVTALEMGETTITASSIDGNISDSITIRVEKHFNISVNEVAGVTVVAPSNALVGELVEVEVSSSTLLIDAVYANEIQCGTMNGKYFFFMPNEEVTINVSTSVASISHVIENGNNQVVTLSASSWVAGENATVSFTLAPGYDFAGVVVNGNINAFDPADMTVVESTVKGNVISFVMPDEDVRITVNVTAHYYSVSIASDANSSFNSLYVDGSSLSKIGGVYRVPFNSTVKVNFYPATSTNSNKAVGCGIKINETNTTITAEDGATYVEFTMPHRNISLDILSKPVYRDITLVNSSHITLSLFSKVDESYVALENNSAIYEDTVYLLATSSSDDYSVFEISGSYTPTTSSYSSKLDINPVNEDGYYSFTMPLSAAGKCSITVSECNAHLFTGKELVGDYAGFNAYSSKFYDESSVGSAKYASISESGIITTKTTDKTLAESVDESGTITTVDEKLLHYENNILVTLWTMSSTSYISSDMQVYFKLEEGTDITDYTYTFACNSGKYFLIEVYDLEETLYASAYVDVTNRALYTNVQIAYESGSRLNDASSGQVLTSEGTYLIDFVSTGSKVTFTIFDAVKGTYTDDSSNTLVLNGNGTATYQDAEWAYTIGEDNSSITLVRFTSTNQYIVVISLDRSAKTFAVTSSTTEELPVFTGGMYSSKSTNNWYFTLNFASPGVVKVFAGYEEGDTSGLWNGTVTSWSYDAASGTLVVNMSNASTITAIYNSETDTFTLVGSFSESSGSYGSLSDGATFTKIN